MEDIKITHTIIPYEQGIDPEIGYIHTRFPLNKPYSIHTDIKDIWDRSWKFTTYISKNINFEVTPSVDPVPVLDHDILELPTSNQCEIEFMTIIPLTKNYSQEINTVEQTLKDLIVKNYSNFY